MVRYDQCDETCTTDCGHCKGQGRPAWMRYATEPDGLMAISILNLHEVQRRPHLAEWLRGQNAEITARMRRLEAAT